MIKQLTKLIGLLVYPPDIRRVYKLRRSVTHFFLRNVSRLNDGHIDTEIQNRRTGRNIPVRLYPAPLTADIHRNRIILFIHGGGWVISDLDTYHKLCTEMAKQTGSYVISVGYRLAPENKFPKGLSDCYAVAEKIYHSAKKYGLPTDSIILVGDSSGGNLCSAVALKALRKKDFRVSKQILFYPVTACEYDDDTPFDSVRKYGTGCFLTRERMKGFLNLYLKDAKQKNNPYVAPLKARSLENMPDSLIITAENDVLRDEGEAFAKRLEESGCKVKVFRFKDAYHNFMLSDTRNIDVRKAYKLIRDFLDEDVI